MARRMAISSLAMLAGLSATFGQSPGVATQVERTIYLQKKADPTGAVQQSQFVTPPPAPKPIFDPVVISTGQAPTLPPLNSIPLPTMSPPSPGLQFVQKEEPKQPGTTPPGATPPGQPSGTPLGNAAAQMPVPTAPKRDDVFRFDDDSTLRNRIKSEIIAEKQGTKSITFPDTLPPSGPAATSVARSMPSMQVMIEPAYVVHRRLFFEQKNTERAGWDFGLIQPVVSAVHFYKDCALWPHKLASNFLEPYDTSAGKSLPGCPTPLLWYPPEITMFGGTVGTAVIIGTAAILP
jgi:hypothetical protein